MAFPKTEIFEALFKFDGSSSNLIYSDGILISAATIDVLDDNVKVGLGTGINFGTGLSFMVYRLREHSPKNNEEEITPQTPITSPVDVFAFTWFCCFNWVTPIIRFSHYRAIKSLLSAWAIPD